MTLAVAYKLLAIIVVVGLGWIAGRQRWLARPQDADPARVLGNAAFYIFVPALLFRTMARLDLGHMPWRSIAAFFVPLLAVLFLCYASQRRAARKHGAAAPAVRTIAAVFGNSVQVGIPFVTAILGEPGLAVLLPLISLHALVLLSVLTVLVELDLAHAHAQKAGTQPLSRTLAQTARNTLIHPVVLPVLAGLAWSLTGWPLHPAVDEALATAAAGVVPTCLVLIGVTLASYGLHGQLRAGALISVVKLLLLPAVVLAVAHGGFGLSGVPLAAAVLMAAMPTGTNAMIFSQRYESLPAEVTAASVLSTVAFAVTAPLWLVVLAWVG
ncbi:MAG: AEC family transporter [Rubrivivax sp.]